MLPTVRARRSVVKAITYRLIIILLDFVTIYALSGRVQIALGFMVVSNLYTTIVYYLHERLWTRTRWGVDS